ncbi:MAG: phosphatase PAP2 family protein [Comamonadaceae bacterium]|nr:MAG: phosphatase PAP2 family protein [Comamonadaceae bacterium]
MTMPAPAERFRGRQPLTPAQLWAITAAALLLLGLWDVSGADLAFAQLAGGPSGFPWKDSPWASRGHAWGRNASGFALACLLLAVAMPFGPLRALGRGQRAKLLLVTAGAMLLVTALKYASTTSCPWDLQVFGGAARQVSHWRWGQSDGGPGRCFPAGHASAAFAFVAGYFALRLHRPHAARLWLAFALLAGLAFGLVQQWRGAHFASHTLWSGWLCWTFALACYSARPTRQLHAPAAG